MDGSKVVVRSQVSRGDSYLFITSQIGGWNDRIGRANDARSQKGSFAGAEPPEFSEDFLLNLKSEIADAVENGSPQRVKTAPQHGCRFDRSGVTHVSAALLQCCRGSYAVPFAEASRNQLEPLPRDAYLVALKTVGGQTLITSSPASST